MGRAMGGRGSRGSGFGSGWPGWKELVPLGNRKEGVRSRAGSGRSTAFLGGRLVDDDGESSGHVIVVVRGRVVFNMGGPDPKWVNVSGSGSGTLAALSGRRGVNDEMGRKWRRREWRNQGREDSGGWLVEWCEWAVSGAVGRQQRAIDGSGG